MSNDSFTKVTSQSWFSRVGSAIAGVVIGMILFVAAFPLLTWNEGRAINRAKTLMMGSSIVVTVPADTVDPANEGKLVHVTADTSAEGEITDEDFGVSAPAIKLQRNVEMYQWTEDSKSESKTKLGGSEETVTTYTYTKKWMPTVIDSSHFEKPEGHTNPEEMPVSGETITADPVMLGAFALPTSLTDMIKDFKALPIKEDDTSAVTVVLSEPVHVYDQGFYIGANPKQPTVGDARVTFETVSPGPVSVIASQVKDTFEPYVGTDGTIELLKAGTFSAKSMFESEKQANTVITWIIRVGGFFMMFIGLTLVTRPLSVLASVVPMFGSLVGAGGALLAFVIALPLTLATVAVAWLAYRPLVGIPLLLLTAAVVWVGFRFLPRKKAAATPAAG